MITSFLGSVVVVYIYLGGMGKLTKGVEVLLPTLPFPVVKVIS